MRGVFVTGTDTGVGKTVVAAAMAAAMRDAGDRVGAFKPVVTGLDEPDGMAARPRAARRGGGAPAPSRSRPTRSARRCRRTSPPSSPATELDPDVLVAAAPRSSRADVLVAEGVGGLLVPLAPGYAVRDLAVALGLPL